MDSFKESVMLLYRSLRRFISLSLILASMFLIVRAYDLVITSNLSNYPPGSAISILSGLKYDLFIFLQVCAVLVVPFLCIAYFSQKVAKYFFIAASVLLILGEILLLQYFSVSRIPLGADLLGYSLQDIKQTVGASGSLRVFPYLMICLYLAFMVRVFMKHVYYRSHALVIVIFSTLMLASMFPLKQIKPRPSGFRNQFNYYLAINKLGFFVESLSNYYFRPGKSSDESFAFQNTFIPGVGESFTYLDPDYPFLHQETTPDVLGEYFNLGETPPNIVFIVAESLGRAYSGEGAYLGSYTPFLDSLMQKSLYWENCLSTSGRTFQVLPSLLASLPYGENGFCEMGEQMPDHLSLIGILKKEANYTSSFVYGGKASFDKMDVFLNRQGVDKIIDEGNFGDGYSKLPATQRGFTWGYGDKEIFSRYLSEYNEKDNTPGVDVILTLAVHDPFNVPHQDYYLQKFENTLSSQNLSEQSKRFNRAYSKQFASLMYFDESLRYFLSEIEKMPAFQNTIFVITGDHRMPEIPISTQIDRFHVPLVVYSPMLKKAKKFKPLVTHFDITPSLLAMLDAENFISRPKVASWIGHGLDCHNSFRNHYPYVLMRNKNEIMDMVASQRFLSNAALYQLQPNMNIEAIDDAEIQAKYKNHLDDFIRKNNYACRNNKLIPDSLKKWTWHNTEEL